MRTTEGGSGGARGMDAAAATRMKIAQAFQKARKDLSEEEKIRRMEAIRAEMEARAARTGGRTDSGGEPGREAVEPAVEGRAGPAEARPAGQKNRDASAGARAPEARGGTPKGGGTGALAGGGTRGQSPSSGGAVTVGQSPGSARNQEEKTKPNRRENEFMLNLMILRNALKQYAPACRERAKRAGRWTWRDIRLMTTLVDRVQEQMLETMPQSREDYYVAYAQHGHYELHMDGPVRTPRYILMTDKHAGAMAEAAMKSECILCIREGSEIGQCPLREALLETAVPTEIQDGDSLARKCEYRDAAGALVQGKDVTI